MWKTFDCQRERGKQVEKTVWMTYISLLEELGKGNYPEVLGYNAEVDLYKVAWPIQTRLGRKVARLLEDQSEPEEVVAIAE